MNADARTRAGQGRRRGLVSPGLSAALFVVAAIAGLSSCGPPCRTIETRPLALECAQTSGFFGELHFDSEATFDTFLRQQCLEGDDAAADRVLASVDFTREAVFVARGNHALDSTRCLESRELDEAQVCATGLKLYFDDVTREPELCPGTRWTVAFLLSREDLRAALDAAP